MKDIIQKIKESYYDFDIDEVVDAIEDVASEVLGKKFDRAKPEEKLDAAEEGEYTEYDKVADIIQCDPDELYDFISDNWDKLIKKLK